jgi:hypothetical protein
MRWSRRALGVTVVLLSGCGPVLPPADAILVGTAHKQWPDVTSVQLERGRILLTTRCVTCHAVRDPGSYTPKDWAYYLDVMGPRAQLTASERQAVERYVLAARELALTR